MVLSINRYNINGSYETLTTFHVASCISLFCSNWVHCPRIREYACPLCFSRLVFCSQYDREALLYAVLSLSMSCIGTSSSASNSPCAMSFCSRASLKGVSGSTCPLPSMSTCKVARWTSRAAYILSWPALTITSRVMCLTMTASSCTGSGNTTAVLFCSSLLMSLP